MVLKSLFAGSRNPRRREEDHAPSAPLARKPTALELKQIMQYFPIGKKIRYVPEYKKEVVLDTLVIGYCANGHFIYSWDAIQFDAQGYPTAFLIGEAQDRIDVTRVGEFELLVPDTSDLENTLDYPRRAMIGRGRQFHKGNAIALISNSGNLGVATLETEVDRKFVMKDGPYAESSMVLLTPQMHSLTVTDQRGSKRARIDVPVTMTIQDRLRGPCMIVDISDVAMRVRVREGHTMPPMSRGDDITLDVDLGDDERQFHIKAQVIRRSAEACVVKLVGLVKDRRVVPFAPLDLLELKAGLLNYGK
ncbi:MAG TPA: PilZ domain-containing protein [Rhodocyclaceae bacterium]|nr:PilZ domain-containing protein [Rhodocyclaceae bacterium]